MCQSKYQADGAESISVRASIEPSTTSPSPAKLTVASQRACRQRQRTLISTMSRETEELKSTNEALQAKNDKLQQQMMTLQQEVLLHFQEDHGVRSLRLPPSPP